MIRRIATTGVLVALACGAVGCDGDGSADICSAERLAAALGAAASGDTVRIGACRIQGSFTVPAGVTLAGRGRDASVVETAGRQPALRLTPGSPPSRATDLSVVSAGNSGILARGTGGGAAVERATVTASRGMAVGVEGLESFAMTDVALAGTVDASNVGYVIPEIDPADPEAPARVDPDDWPTHGLAVVDVGSVILSGVSASGFASLGAMFVDSTTEWRGGGAARNLGTGVLVHGGSATLDDLDLSGSMAGFLLTPAYGAVFAGGADVRSTGLLASNGDGLGLLHLDATASHVDLVARDNGDAAIWVQGCDRLELSGSGTMIRGNRFGGVVSVDSGDLSLSDGRIDDTSMATRVFGETGSVLVGDGVQIVRPAGAVVLRNLALSGNARTGLLLDLGGAPLDAVTIEGVSVEGAGTQLGAVAQGGTVPEGWDSGITRAGATVENDAAFRGTMSIVGLVAPDDMPPTSGVERDGLNGVHDPDPPP